MMILLILLIDLFTRKTSTRPLDNTFSLNTSQPFVGNSLSRLKFLKNESRFRCPHPCAAEGLMKCAINFECLGSSGLSQKVSKGYEFTERSDFESPIIFPTLSKRDSWSLLSLLIGTSC